MSCNASLCYATSIISQPSTHNDNINKIMYNIYNLEELTVKKCSEIEKNLDAKYTSKRKWLATRIWGGGSKQSPTFRR